jgi:hypothetical protein
VCTEICGEARSESGLFLDQHIWRPPGPMLTGLNTTSAKVTTTITERVRCVLAITVIRSLVDNQSRVHLYARPATTSRMLVLATSLLLLSSLVQAAADDKSRLGNHTIERVSTCIQAFSTHATWYRLVQTRQSFLISLLFPDTTASNTLLIRPIHRPGLAKPVCRAHIFIPQTLYL